MLFESDCGPSPRMIDVANDVETGQGKLFVLHLLQENDVQIGCLDECTEGIDFRCVGYRVDIDSAYIYAGVLHYCCISSPEPRMCSLESLCRIFFPGGDRLLRNRRLLLEPSDA